MPDRRQTLDRNDALEVLRPYNQLLFEWKPLCPAASGEDFHFLFVEALRNSTAVRHLMTEPAFGTEEKREIYLHHRV